MKRSAIVVAMLLALTGLLFAQDWRLTVNVFSGDRTSSRPLVLGVDYRGTDCFDEAIDAPLIPGSPYSFYAYFVALCTTGLPVGMDPYLGTDVRNSLPPSDFSPVQWVLRDGGSGSPAMRLVTWNLDELPLLDEGKSTTAWAASMAIGSRTIGSALPPSTWVDMASVDSFRFPAGSEVIISAVLEGTEDLNAPQVTNLHPADGSEGIRWGDSIFCNITDDVAGVDRASLEVTIEIESATLDTTMTFAGTDLDARLIPIVRGYKFYYNYPGDMPGDADICITVEASDLADPVHIMEPFTWCFRTNDTPEGDYWAPAFNTWTAAGLPMIITAVDTIESNDQICFNVRDEGVGVNSATIAVSVDGLDITDLCDVTALGLDYSYQVCYSPAFFGGWSAGMVHQLIVDACDFSSNCAVPETVQFYVNPADIPDWLYEITLNNGFASSILTFGLREGAELGYDDLDNVAFAMPGFYSYFPLSDPTSTFTMLSRDVRPTHLGYEVWQINTENATGDVAISWNPSAIPAIEGFVLTLYIGVGPEGSSISYEPMDGFATIVASPTDNIYIRANIVPEGSEGTAPIVRNLNPAANATGVSTSTNVCFDLQDDIGVNLTTLMVTLNGANVTSALSIAPIALGYRVCYDYPGLLMSGTEYQVRVRVDDMDVVMHSLDTTYVFTTGSSCGPHFNLEITGADSTSGTINYRAITIGADSTALLGYDPLDIVAFPSMGFGIKSKNMDASDTLFAYLLRDIRSTCSTNEWRIYFESFTGTHQWLQWNPAAVFVSSSWALYAAVGTAAAAPAAGDYRNMSEFNRLAVGPGQIVYIQYRTPPPPISYSLSGTVTDSITMAPLSGVTVSVEGGGVDITGADGAYLIDFLADGTDYNVTYTKTGYTTADRAVSIDGADVTLNVRLSMPTVRVCGNTIIGGVPTPGVQYWFGTLHGVSDVAGHYCVDVLPGSYEVRASFPGYLDFTGSVDVTAAMTYDIVFPTPHYYIYGTASLEGTPSAGVQIRINDGTPIVTDAAGYYSSSVSSTGTYTVTASYSGYGTATQFATVISESTLVNFNLTAVPVDVTINVNLEGATTDAGAEVLLESYGTQMTPASGTVTYTGVSRGTYTLTVRKDYFETYTEEIDVTGPGSFDVTLNYYYPATALACEYAPTERPYDTPLAVSLTWSAPTGTLTPTRYHVYRSDMPGELGTATGTSYTDEDVSDDNFYQYYIVAEYAGAGLSPQSTPCAVNINVAEDPSAILVIDFDNGAGFADDLMGELSAIGISSVTITGPSEDISLTHAYNFNDYDAILVVLDVRGVGTGANISSAMLTMLNDYTRKIWVMGPDFAQDYSGTPFLNRFGFSGVDGQPSTIGNVQTVKMNSSFFAGAAWNSSYAYRTDADHYVDLLNPTAGTTSFLYANADSMIVGVKRGNYYYTSIYVTEFLAAVEARRYLGGIMLDLGFGNTGIEDETVIAKPKAMSLVTRPNPFNAACDVTFEVPATGIATVEVYDLRGNLVATLNNDVLSSGVHTVTWNAENAASGVYMVKLSVAGKTMTKNISLIK